MDVSLAKTLVSSGLVLAITGFSLISFEAFIREAIRDVRAGLSERAEASRRRAEAPSDRLKDLVSH